MAAPYLILMAALLLGGCAATVPDAAAPSSRALPTGAQLSPSGYLTIREAPPPPFPVEPPPEPEFVDDFARRTSSPDPAVRAKAWEEANGSPAFQAELQRLARTLAQAEPDNYVNMRLVRDPGVAAEVWFRRDAARTLARYTTEPLFRPREGGSDLAERERQHALWVARMQGEPRIHSVSMGVEDRVKVGVAIEEAEFRAYAATRGWELSPAVTFSFASPQPPAFVDPSLARYVRVFAREANAKGIQLTGGFRGRIVLEDGCFRLPERESGEPGPLVMFERHTQLGLDDENYLVVIGGPERERRYRVGEMGSWGGPNGIDEDDPDVRELRRQCGQGPLVNVAEPQSQRLFALPDPEWVADHARARKIPYREAWRRVIACMEREEARRPGLGARDRCIRQFN
ncbi:MAG TPA: hypothetical protein VEZ70_13750 [Allosphingosinicella sp.]|nr:hypothetical protein [Allosphingosinicella sp.]